MEKETLRAKIIEYENISKKLDSDIETMKTRVQELKNNLEDYKKLFSYYTSEEWLEDFDRSNNSDIFQDIEHGILSEDQLWNILAELNELAKTMIRLGVDILEI